MNLIEPRPPGALAQDSSRAEYELRGHAVTERNGSSLVEQQGVDVAGGLYRVAANCHDVFADRTVHAGYADRR